MICNNSKTMTMRKIVLVMFFCIYVFNAFSQGRVITGKVTDASGNPVPAANVVIKGTTIGTSTEVSGFYSITCRSEADILVFSFIGMSTREVSVGNKSVIDVTLLPETAFLDDIVVVGYGTVKKSDLTGSVSSVKAEDSFKTPVSNIGQALQGRASGVFVTSVNNSPGGEVSIRIRGGNSITAGNEPLYVIDGFIGVGSLSNISPSDIESIEILKDASSTSIYGTRGANGVVLITTKKGLAGKPQIKISSSYGLQKVSNKIPVQKVRSFAEYQNEGAILNSSVPPYDLNNLPEGTDWQEVGMRNAYVNDNNISIQGGGKETQYYMSANYFNQQGVLLSNEFKRNNFRILLDQKISSFLKVGINLNYSHLFYDNPKYSAWQLHNLNPVTSAYDEDGNYTYRHADGELFSNPLASAEMETDENIIDRLLAISNVEIDFLKAFSFKTSLSANYTFNTRNVYLPGSLPIRLAQELGGEGSVSNVRGITVLNENILGFDKDFGYTNLNAIIGFTTQTYYSESIYVAGSKLQNDVTKFYALQFTDPELRDISTGYDQWAIASFIGRINLSLGSKYLITASFRRDGSSRLGRNNKWANFPSAAFAWKMSEEEFISDLNIFSNLKLRASYGITGNQGIPTFSTLPRLGTNQAIVNNTIVNGVYQSTLENPNIRWETTAQYDIGLESGFFDNRLNIELDYFYKKTTDLLFDVEVPHMTGFQTQLQNIGSLQNHGYEVAVNAKLIAKSQFSWEITGNISHYKNKILNLGDNEYIDTYRLPAPSRALTGRLIVGEPLGIFIGYTFDGIDPETGDMKFKDINDDGVINALDEGIIGNSNPKFFGGLQNSIKYKNIGLSLFFQGSYGNDLYNTRLYQAMNLGNSNSYSKVRDNRWTPDEPESALWPGAGISSGILISNTSFIQNGSYLRMKSLELSYTIPVLKELVKELRIALTGTNLFLLKDKEYLGYDPEVNEFGTSDLYRGYDNIVYPNNRSYVLAVSLSF